MKRPKGLIESRHFVKNVFFLLLGMVIIVGLTACTSSRSSSSGYRTLDDYKEAAASVEYNPNYSGPMFPAQATEDGLFGFIGTDGKWAIEPAFSDAYVFSEGLALVRDPQTNDFGFIDESGSYVIPPQYKRAGEFHSGLAWAKLDKHDELFGEYEYIDKTGKTVLTGGIAAVTDFSDDGNAWMWLRDEKSEFTTVLFNARTGQIETKLDGRVSLRTPHEGLSAFGTAGAYGYMNDEGKTVIPRDYKKLGDFSEGVAAAARAHDNGYYGYIDESGNTVIDQKFKFAGEFVNGLAPVRTLDNANIFIDHDGNSAFEETFPFIDCFSEDGYAAAGHIVGSILPIYGLIDEEGNWVVEPLFYFIRSTNIGPMLNINDNPAPILSSADMGSALKASDGISD